MALSLSYNDFKACCGSKQFAKHMVAEGPFDTYDETVVAANNIWFNKVDVNGWLEAFAAHPQIGQNQPSYKTSSTTSAQWSKGEQSTALATATDSTLQELYEWNSRYREKFGFVFLICASGRTTPEILSELKPHETTLYADSNNSIYDVRGYIFRGHNIRTQGWCFGGVTSIGLLLQPRHKSYNSFGVYDVRGATLTGLLPPRPTAGSSGKRRHHLITSHFLKNQEFEMSGYHV
nr:uric acid degradation bifunctional protein TTL isoform X1 [Tanacetum cinerariifolium]